MDLEEWEVLSDDGFLEIHDDGGGNKIFSRKYAAAAAADPNNTSSSVDLDNNYFICPSPRKTSSANHQLVLPLPIQDEFDDAKKLVELVKEDEVKFPSNYNNNNNRGAVMETTAAASDGDQEEEAAVSQVFFKKLNETHEFVDMKLDSPKSAGGGGGGWGVLPQIEPLPMVQFEKESATGDAGSPKMEEEEKKMRMEEEAEDEDSSDGINNIWKWSLHGIGAICSFGVAAATICVIILGSSNSSSHHKNQNIRFQIYADDEKRIKQVVVEQANSKLNEAILAVRGVPLSRRAHFTCGGYYEGL